MAAPAPRGIWDEVLPASGGRDGHVSRGVTACLLGLPPGEWLVHFRPCVGVMWTGSAWAPHHHSSRSDPGPAGSTKAFSVFPVYKNATYS